MGKHKEVLELLPWFLNDSLVGRERSVVIAHLSECQDCRHERDRLQELQKLISEDTPPAVNPRGAFQRLMGRIEDAEKDRASTEFRGGGAPFGKWMPAFGLAASVLVTVAITAFLWIPDDGNKDRDFVTLTTVPENAGVPHRVALTFEQPIRARTMRQALIETRSDIVSGPDGRGVYIVEVTIPEGTSDRQFIDWIKGIEGVKDASFASD